MQIPLHFFPWRAKAEIARLKAKLIPVEAVNGLLTTEQTDHAETKSKLEAASKELETLNDRLTKLNRWIMLTHGINGLRVAKGRTVDILKRPQTRNEKAIHITLPPVLPVVP